MSPAAIFAEVIDVRIQGFDDGVKSTKQRDYEEAVLFAKRQAIERAGVTIKSKTTVENLMLQKDYIEAQSEAVLLPGYQVLDIGYLENGSYSIILIGKIKTQDSKGIADADRFWFGTWGMSVKQVQEIANALNLKVEITRWGNNAKLMTEEIRNTWGCKVGIGFTYDFKNDRLYKASYSEACPMPIWFSDYKVEEVSPWCKVWIEGNYKEQVNDLIKKYGTPVKNERYEKIWVLPSTSIEGVYIEPLNIHNWDYEQR